METSKGGWREGHLRSRPEFFLRLASSLLEMSMIKTASLDVQQGAFLDFEHLCMKFAGMGLNMLPTRLGPNNNLKVWIGA